MGQDLKIILHLGPHKTGSTSIQKNLFAHKETLARHGIHFLGSSGPYPHLDSAFMTDPTRNYRNRRAGLSLSDIQARDAQVRDKLFTQLAGLSGTAILSSEFLCLLDPKELARIHRALAQYGQVHALYYYRELLPWIASNSQQMAKVGRFFRPSTYEASVRRIHAFPLRIASEFGTQHSHFLKFEHATKQGMCNSLLRAFGLVDFDTLGLSETHENESLSDRAVRAMYLYNIKNPIGSGRRQPQKIAQICALPGQKYQIDGLRHHQIRDYARKRAEVAQKLGFELIPAQDIPRAAKLDAQNARQIAPYLPMGERLKALVKSLRR
ncbi:hypothetical protein ACSSNL_09340 [Thalassobius sp. S69A]|uniref:hypothetical protein n=1 Tax=unclassified Thalassovita TaxID=2619711 RepID=UPI003C7BAEED